jgi:L-fuconolactonase
LQTVEPGSSDWLALSVEEIIEPDLPIVDPHHHLWAHRGRYLLEEVLADIGSGHNVRATVFMEADAMYRAGAAPELAPIGETEFVNGVAAMSASGFYGSARVCAGIVGFADLVGDRVEDLLDAHVSAAGCRFKGVRQCTAFDPDPNIVTLPFAVPERMMSDERFQRNVGLLAPRGLSLDAWMYHPQLPEFLALARKFPDATMVLDHVGGALGIGPYAGKRDEVFQGWRENIRAIAKCPNVNIKLGGLGMSLFGFGFEARQKPAGSGELAQAWRPYVETCIEAFGVEKSMFESNFPVDRQSCTYATLWNAFKRLAIGATPAEKASLFSGTAIRVYRLPPIAGYAPEDATPATHGQL